jgi:lysophospholipase L1-like esterase
MNTNNKFRQPLIIVAIVTGILFAISFINYEVDIPSINFKIRNVDILSDIKDDLSLPQSINHNSNIGPVERKKIQYSEAGFGFPELILDVLNSSVVKNENINENIQSVQIKKTSITGNLKQLSYFYDALKNAKSKTVRIAHYGDSAIEGDYITADIREVLQNKFGGSGAGWLGITSQDITFRQTTKHTFSNNWETAALYQSNPKNIPLGISGEAFTPKGNAWVQYETTSFKRSLKDFSIVKLYYSNAKNSQIYYSFDGGAKQSVALKPGSSVQELILKSSSRVKSVRIEFPTADQATFYGVSLENEPGVYVDNLPLRGNTGVDLGTLQANMLKDFGKYLDYKLIILEFGLNIAGSRQTNYDWYEKEMVKVINNLKVAFPKTSFLMISVQDKSMKKGSNFVTDPAILKLLESQKNIARETDIAYWSLFDAMGGENSMHSWVDANPPLASADHIHFNPTGAQKIGNIIAEALLEKYK